MGRSLEIAWGTATIEVGTRAGSFALGVLSVVVHMTSIFVKGTILLCYVIYGLSKRPSPCREYHCCYAPYAALYLFKP